MPAGYDARCGQRSLGPQKPFEQEDDDEYDYDCVAVPLLTPRF
jgi:hypothetical protein